MKSRQALLVVFLLALAISAFTLPLAAQSRPDSDQGTSPFGSYDESNIDSIGLSSGNLTIHGPLTSYPQRGGKLSLGYFIRYNNKSWYIKTTTTPSGYTTQRWAYKGNGIEIGRDQVMTLKIDWTCDNCSGGFGQVLMFYTAYSADGSAHALAHVSDMVYESIDATGIRYEGSVLTDRAGIRYTNVLLSNTANPPGGLAVSSEDPNGNQITSSSGWTDTLGRLIPAPASTSDLSNCPSGTIAAANWMFPGPSGGTAPVKVCSASYTIQTSFGRSGVAEYIGPQTLVNAIILPNLTSWKFSYNTWGDLSSITFPAGGSISYTWITNGDGFSESRWVSSRSVDAGDGSGPKTWNYTWSVPVGTMTNVVTDPLGNDTVHVETDLSNSHFYETQAQFYKNSRTTGTLLKTVNTAYSYLPNSNFEIANVVPATITTVWPNGQTSKIEKTYDATGDTFYDSNYPPPYTYDPLVYGNLVRQTEFDYGLNASGPALRTTVNSYLGLNDPSYKALNLLDLPSSTVIQDGLGARQAETDYAYDQTTLLGSGISMQRNPSPATGARRGNATTFSRWLNTSNTFLNSVNSYYDTGAVYQATDPAGHATTFSYSPSFYGAYVTQTQFPDTGSPPVHHMVSVNYDFNSALKTSATDQNSQTTTYQYDNMWRRISAIFPDGGQSTFAYTDTPGAVSVEHRVKQTAINWIDNFAYFDNLGRVKQSKLNSDPEGPVYVDTTYDVLGRAATVSNPYRQLSEPTYGLTQYAYDALGRTTDLTRQNGNIIHTDYAGNVVTVTDETGKQRQSVSDGLGRLTTVWEPDPSTGIFAYETGYQYDTLDNLLRVDQKGGSADSTQWRTRTFVYDSLSRLTSASNPESGSQSYSYDANGNVLTKTDARNITVTYAYDQLNRLTGKTYSNSDPAVSYSYDSASVTNGIGRRTGMTDASGSAIWGYDLDLPPVFGPVIVTQPAG